MSVKAARRDFARATREAERAVVAGWHELADAYETATDRGLDLAGTARDRGHDLVGSARDRANDARDRANDARERGYGLVSSARDRANDARDRAGSARDKASRRSHDLAGTARDRASDALDRANEARDRVMELQREARRRGEAARDALAGRKTHQRRTLFLAAAAGVGVGAALVIASRRLAAARERARLAEVLPEVDDVDDTTAVPDFPPTD